MKQILPLLVLCCIVRKGLSQLSAITLISAQLDFLENMCINRSDSETVFGELKETIEDCEALILNGTDLTLTYNTLSEADPRKFYSFYMSQCHDSAAIEQRNDCNNRSVGLLKQCLNETEVESFNKVEDIALRIYHVMCEMDQEKMKNFFSNSGQECLSDNVITIFYCFLSELPDNHEERQHFLFNLIEGKECKVIDGIENCMMPGLSSCEEKSVSYIFKLLFEFFRQELRCESVQEIKPDLNFSAHLQSSMLLVSINTFVLLRP